MSVKVAPIAQEHFDVWLPLWKGYQDALDEPLPDDITRFTFNRATGDDADLGGFIALSEDGNAVGMVMYVFHATTFSRVDRCYLEDLFTAEEARGKGVARALILAVQGEAERRGSDQVYWHTEEDNTQARLLYDKVAALSNHIKYKVKLNP